MNASPGQQVSRCGRVAMAEVELTSCCFRLTTFGSS